MPSTYPTSEITRILCLPPPCRIPPQVLSLPHELFHPSTPAPLRIRETRRAYKFKSLRIHPDRCRTDPGATEAFRILHKVYEDVVLRGWVTVDVSSSSSPSVVKTKEEMETELEGWMSKTHERYFRGRKRAGSEAFSAKQGQDGFGDEADEDDFEVEWLRKMHSRAGIRRGWKKSENVNDSYSSFMTSGESESEDDDNSRLPQCLQDMYPRRKQQQQQQPSQREDDDDDDHHRLQSKSASDFLHSSEDEDSHVHDSQLISNDELSRSPSQTGSLPDLSSFAQHPDQSQIGTTNDQNASTRFSSDSEDDKDTPFWIRHMHQTDRWVRRGARNTSRTRRRREPISPSIDHLTLPNLPKKSLHEFRLRSLSDPVVHTSARRQPPSRSRSPFVQIFPDEWDEDDGE